MLHHIDTCVQHVTMLKGGAERAMQPVFEIELAIPVDDVRKEIAEEGGVLVKQGGEVEGVFRGDELVESDLVRGQLRPVAYGQTVVGIRPSVADPLENHPAECIEQGVVRPAARLHG
jgi:hypothetical protein